MADIFLSYASEDRERVRPLVEALEKLGYSVWWDHRIGMGASFDLEIERELDQASCVVVVWSQNSVRSEWVRNEAMEGQDRGILVPVQIDDIRLPLVARRVQTANLTGWPAERHEEVLAQLATSVRAYVGDSDKRDRAVASEEQGSAAVEQGKVHFVTTTDGVRVAYALTGEGPPLVKAAHWLTNLDLDWQSIIWRHWLRDLSSAHQLIRYDQRGCGLTDRDPDDLSLDAMVGDLEDVVSAAGLQKFALLGASQGGPIAIRYAIEHPERVKALILYGSYSQGWARRGDPEVVESGRAMIELVRFGWGKDNPAFRQMFGSLFIPDANEEQREAFDYMQRESATPELAARLMVASGEVDVSDLLPRLSVPVLVVHARGDSRIPYELGRALASRIPNSEFQSLDSRNHIVMEHEPAFAVLISAIRNFLKCHPE